MDFLKSRPIRFYLVFFAILAMALGSSVAAFADSSTGATVTVTAGSLSESGPSSVSATAVTLNGSDQSTSYSLGLTVNDARGTGAGWNLTITSTQFSDGQGHTLASTASSIGSTPGVVCVTGGSCTSPTNNVTYPPLTVPAGSTPPTAVKFFNATANTGLGRFTITPTITIAIPANTIAGSYSSTVTVAVVSGP